MSSTTFRDRNRHLPRQVRLPIGFYYSDDFSQCSILTDRLKRPIRRATHFARKVKLIGAVFFQQLAHENGKHTQNNPMIKFTYSENATLGYQMTRRWGWQKCSVIVSQHTCEQSCLG